MIIIALLMMICRLRLPKVCARGKFSPTAVWASSLSFIHGTFFELSVSVCLSMYMLEYYSLWNKADHVSIYASIFIAAVLVC